MLQNRDDLQSIRQPLALTARLLAEAAGPMAPAAVPALGSPPERASAMPIASAKLLADPAAPIAAAVPLIVRAVPALGVPAAPAAGVPAAGVPPSRAPPKR